MEGLLAMIPSPVQVDTLRGGVYLRSDGQKKAARERAASSQRFARCEERCAASAVRMRQGIAVRPSNGAYERLQTRCQPQLVECLRLRTGCCNNFLHLFSNSADSLEFDFEWSFKEVNPDDTPSKIVFTQEDRDKISAFKIFAVFAISIFTLPLTQ